MTEFEIREVLSNTYGTMNEAAVMYFTLVSAYLATSYLVGKKLSGRQLVIINVLYVIWVSGTINTMYSMLLIAEETLERLGEVATVASHSGSAEWAVVTFLFVQIGGLVASLYFMWTTRRSED